MKTVFALIAIAVLGTGLGIAQPTGGGQKKNFAEMRDKMKERREEMATKLNLSEDQKAQMDAFRESQKEKMQASGYSREDLKNMSKEERQALMMSMKEERDAFMQTVLSPDQLAQLETMKAEGKAKREAAGKTRSPVTQ